MPRLTMREAEQLIHGYSHEYGTCESLTDYEEREPDYCPTRITCGGVARVRFPDNDRTRVTRREARLRQLN